MDGRIQTCYVPSRQNWWTPLPPTRGRKTVEPVGSFAGSDRPSGAAGRGIATFLFLESSRCIKGSCRGWVAAGATLWKVISSGQFLVVWEVLK